MSASMDMDLNASPEPEDDEVSPERHSEADYALEEKVEYDGESAVQIRLRVLLHLNFCGSK